MRELGKLEAAVMDVVWSLGSPVSVREVLGIIQRDRRIAYTTVMTVLDNLHSKGLLARHLDGRAYRYVTTMTREEYGSELMGSVLDGSTDRSATLLSFIERIPLGEARRLRQALDARLDGRDTPS